MPSSLRFLSVVLTSLLLTACGTSLHRAPVEDRNPQAARVTPPAAPASAASAAAAEVKPPPGAENAGKPGYYTVKPGDALIRIALDNGQSWRDVADKRFGMPVRIMGIVLAAVFVASLWVFQQWFSTPILTSNVKQALVAMNGATVDSSAH